MAADRSKYPVVHLVRQHPVGGCRSRVPYSRRSAWAPSPAPARRRDRHPQDLNPLFAGGSGRTPRNRASQKRGTLQVHAMVGKVLLEIPAPYRSAGSQSLGGVEKGTGAGKTVQSLAARDGP